MPRARRTAVTQQAVERALGKLLTDENLLERFFESPKAASWEAGLALSPIELEALSRVPRAALVSLHDDRSRGGRKGGAAMMDLIVQRDGSRGIRRLAVQGATELTRRDEQREAGHERDDGIGDDARRGR